MESDFFHNILYYRLWGALYFAAAVGACIFYLLYHRSPRYLATTLPFMVFVVATCLPLGVGFLFFPLVPSSQLYNFSVAAEAFFVVGANLVSFFQAPKIWRFWKENRHLPKQERLLKEFEPYTLEEIKIRVRLYYLVLATTILFGLLWIFLQKRMQ